MEGLIPREEGAVGIAEGSTRDIALSSRVSKPVCFVVKGFEPTADGGRRALLSRREAQEQCRYHYLNHLADRRYYPRPHHAAGDLRRLL